MLNAAVELDMPKSAINAVHVTPMASKGRSPALRRSARTTCSAGSASGKRQQTITQMNPFHAIFHPEDYDEELQYLDDITGSYQHSPHRSKRRKIMTDDTPMPLVRTKRPRQTATEMNARPAIGNKAEDRIAYSDSRKGDSNFEVSNLKPPPPKTPVTIKNEIPSSQSPAETPPSMKTTRKNKDIDRSPLKERSANIVKPKSTLKDLDDWSPGEIKGNLENQREGAKSGQRDPGSSRKFRMTAEDTFEKASYLSSSRVKISKNKIRGGSITKETPSHLSSQEKTRSDLCATESKARKRIEVLDSDVEDEGDDDGIYPDYNHGFFRAEPLNIDMVAVNTKTEMLKASTNIQSELNFQSTEHPSEAFGKSAWTNQQSEASIDVPSSQPECDNLNLPNVNDESHLAHKNNTQKPMFDRHQPVVACKTPIKSQGGLLLTESEFEKGWNSYHPPAIPSTQPQPPSSSIPQPLPSSKSSKSNSTPLTIPTQHLPPIAMIKSPIPPSQATTVDTTTTSQRSPPPRPIPSQIIPSSPSPVKQPYSPPPPIPPALSSSPLLMSRQGINEGTSSTAAGYEWDGRVLTDSQLLPASIMDDSSLLMMSSPPPGEWGDGDG